MVLARQVEDLEKQVANWVKSVDIAARLPKKKSRSTLDYTKRDCQGKSFYVISSMQLTEQSCSVADRLLDLLSVTDILISEGELRRHQEDHSADAKSSELKLVYRRRYQVSCQTSELQYISNTYPYEW